MRDEVKMNLEDRLKSEYEKEHTMSKREQIEELEGELARANERAKMWEERCQISWDLRDQMKLTHEGEIENLNAEIKRLESELEFIGKGTSSSEIELEELERECADLKAENNLYFRILNKLLEEKR